MGLGRGVEGLMRVKADLSLSAQCPSAEPGQTEPIRLLTSWLGPWVAGLFGMAEA